MISAAIEHIAEQLNQFLRRSHQLADDIVVVSNIVAQNGSVAPHIANKLVICLANIEKDTLPQQSYAPHDGAGRAAVYGKPLFLNLYVVVAANFSDKNYPEALKFISSAIGFFQHTPVFDHQVTPGLDARIEKLLLDMENLKTHELSNLWGMLSGHYLPSVLYKVRMIGYGAGPLAGQATTVAQPVTSAGH
ncbi:DUF4255 domain-containing protein [Janthinobacterium sp. BJB1]|uniref:DUF4255 domain-containing protein n=1 Tax=Janthinobacterium sp. GW458P TaxID=1981504 RepID=UPI000A31EF70|nr:DUF4255 domain-containing protein [Janthinobacterium sp. GW458P]MBE3024392.1 DUF4255 domain-containing protein [Janthinobacterium sp. GW458P]PHV15167.1 DUF4255 domain-containing protein [Janthinobacterium sp. BJB303]PJC98154.1 DUF4255 domain-containing protein [Janthinobacterium sp. BJB1]